MNFLFLIFASTVHITSGFDKTFCKCDESINTEGRIMGGEDVPRGTIRYVGSFFGIRPSDKEANTIIFTLYCTATIINPRYAITSYHCINMFRKDHQNKTGKSYVSAGSDHTLPNTWFNTGHYKQVEEVLQERPFDDVYEDLALLRLASDFEFGGKTNIFPACFTDRNLKIFSEQLVSVGYGYKPEKKGNKTTNLDTKIKPKFIKEYANKKVKTRNVWTTRPKMLTVKVVRMDNKINAQNEDCLDEENFVCAQAENGSVCHGDFGGPLIYNYGKNYNLVIAITNGGLSTKNKETNESLLCIKNSSNKYLKVSPYLSYLRDQLNDDLCLVHSKQKKRAKMENQSYQILPILNIAFMIILIVAIVASGAFFKLKKIET